MSGPPPLLRRDGCPSDLPTFSIHSQRPRSSAEVVRIGGRPLSLDVILHDTHARGDTQAGSTADEHDDPGSAYNRIMCHR